MSNFAILFIFFNLMGSINKAHTFVTHMLSEQNVYYNIHFIVIIIIVRVLHHYTRHDRTTGKTTQNNRLKYQSIWTLSDFYDNAPFYSSTFCFAHTHSHKISPYTLIHQKMEIFPFIHFRSISFIKSFYTLTLIDISAHMYLQIYFRSAIYVWGATIDIQHYLVRKK